MSFCGCFKCCCSDEDTARKESQSQRYVNEGFEREKRPSENTLNPEEKLWGNVLGELQMQFNSLRDPCEDLAPEKSMTWVFKILKPVPVETLREKRPTEVPNYTKILKSPLQTKAAKEVIDQFKTTKCLPPLSHSTTMSNVVPSIGKPAPIFKGKAVINGEFKDISLLDYAGKYVVLFFYPLDFTFVCPTEIIAFSERAEDFRNIGCEVVACSTDSHFSHLAWVNTERKDGGLGAMNIPLLADKSMEVAKAYGVLKEDEGIAFRGLFIIDGQQNLRQITINDLPVGRDVDETLRLVQAFQFTDEYGEVCPAGWKPGSKTMKADPKGSKEYFASEN